MGGVGSMSTFWAIAAAIGALMLAANILVLWPWARSMGRTRVHNRGLMTGLLLAWVVYGAILLTIVTSGLAMS